MNRYYFLILQFCLLSSCSNNIYKLRRADPTLKVSHTESESGKYKIGLSGTSNGLSRSFTYTDTSGKEMIVNETVKDTLSGEMVSLRYLNEVVVTARSRNISERSGIIRLGFVIKIPSIIQDSRWQIDMLPILRRGKDTMHFSRILLSGEDFKRAQMKGYKRYERYLRSIIPDDADFFEFYTDLPNLILFLERNLPQSQILAGKRDDSLKSEFGVSERKIVDHYVRDWLIEKNARRKTERERYFKKYVKNPMIAGSKLDSVIRMGNGDFAYHYSQEIMTNEESSKLFLNLYGIVRDVSGLSLKLRPSDTLVYNVSSMVNFIDTTVRYVRKIVERRALSNMSANINFRSGDYRIDASISENIKELDMIKNSLRQVLQNDDYELDSLIITAAASPEGSFASNKVLSARRAASIKDFCKEFAESLEEETYSYDYGSDSLVRSGDISSRFENVIIVRNIPEDWEMLERQIRLDTNISNKDKLMSYMKIEDLDGRESAISLLKKDYRYIKDNLYPKLRRVSFRFHLHRRGMIKDTVHTNEIDTVYMRGVSLLKERKYNMALSILNEYQDFNTAVAHISLGHDRSAEMILEKCPESAYKIYLLALLAARKGDEKMAVKYFLQAKELNFSMAYRGSLDPEISHIIRKYNLNEDLFK